MGGKYIIIEAHDEQIAVLLGYQASHADTKPMGKPIRAGFWRLERDGTIRCWGRSGSLELSSDPKADEELLWVQFQVFARQLTPPATNSRSETPDGMLKLAAGGRPQSALRTGSDIAQPSNS